MQSILGDRTGSTQLYVFVAMVTGHPSERPLQTPAETHKSSVCDHTLRFLSPTETHVTHQQEVTPHLVSLCVDRHLLLQ